MLTSTKELKYLGFLLNLETMSKEKNDKQKKRIIFYQRTHTSDWKTCGCFPSSKLGTSAPQRTRKSLKKLTLKGKKENVDAISELSREA